MRKNTKKVVEISRLPHSLLSGYVLLVEEISLTVLLTPYILISRFSPYKSLRESSRALY